MAHRSKFVRNEVFRLSTTQAAFEDWLTEEGYQPAPAFSAAGCDATDLIEDFIEDTDLSIGLKRRNQLERLASAIGHVVIGSEFVIEDPTDDDIDDDDE